MGAVVGLIKPRVEGMEKVSEDLNIRMASVECKLEETRTLLDATRRDLNAEKQSFLQLKKDFE